MDVNKVRVGETTTQDQQHHKRDGKVYAIKSYSRKRGPSYVFVVANDKAAVKWQTLEDFDADPERELKVNDVLKGPDSFAWTQAFIKELAAIDKNHVWILCERPEGKRLIGTKWVLKIKIDSIDGLTKFKARLVVLGNLAIDGEDFIATYLYAPVAKLPSLRVFISIVVQLGMFIVQVDVDTAFQMAQLDDDIYIGIPECFQLYYGNEYLQKFRRPCLKLLRALYGLPQSPKAWFETINRVLHDLGYVALNNEPCLYFKMNEYNKLVALTVLYVDDMLIANTIKRELEAIIERMKARFNLKINWNPKKILGINIEYDRESGFACFHQRDKIKELAEMIQFRYDQNEVLPNQPLEHSMKCLKPEKTEVILDESGMTRYRTYLGKLMYIMTATRPDLCFAVSFLSRYSHQPTQRHMRAVIQVIKYLIGTKDRYELRFMRHNWNNYRLVAYSDSDWATDKVKRRSQTGGVILLAGTPVIWLSTQQTTVALSSTEAEINALRIVTKQVLWMRHVLKQLNVLSEQTTPIYEDNTSAIMLVNNPAVNNTNRHTDISHKFIVENIVEFKTVKIEHIPTQVNLADVFTKIPTPEIFQRLVGYLFKLYQNPMGNNIL